MTTTKTTTMDYRIVVWHGEGGTLTTGGGLPATVTITVFANDVSLARRDYDMLLARRRVRVEGVERSITRLLARHPGARVERYSQGRRVDALSAR